MSFFWELDDEIELPGWNVLADISFRKKWHYMF